ncbi:MAG: DUF5717 family protein [Clostridiales bacterium]|nr:DUF5717 family protein [Clostridiales bacterium]
MKGIVEQYARGEFKVDRPEVDISDGKIELNIEAGTVYDGQFTVNSKNSCAVKLMVYDSRYILDFKSHTFVGKKNTVAYSFDARGIEQGKSFKGHINVITDGGEFIIPYHISVVAPYIQVEDRKIEDLFQFASYAEGNWEDAIRIFGSEDFVRTFIGDDENLQRIYDTLGLSLSINQAMEEFLVYTHKKRALTLSAAQDDLLVEMPQELVRASVTINKNTWGYTRTNIASDCDFLIPETTTLKGDMFDGNSFELTFLIDPQKIHDGENAGCIYIWNTYQNMRVRVNIRKPEVVKMTPKSRQTRFTIKRAEEALVRSYISFRTDKIDLNKYISDTREALGTLIKYRPENGLYRLGLLHMQILEGRIGFVQQEFLRIDADANYASMDDMEKCYLSYLKALLSREKFMIDYTVRIVREKFNCGGNKLFYFWILLFVDMNYTEDKWVLYEDIQKLFNEGVNSPVIYFEMCDMFNKQPLMMKKIAPLEIAALRWGMRNEFVSEDVIVEFVKTASRQKEFDSHSFRMLEQIYDKRHDRTTLDAICGILIKNKMYDPQYHRYYSDASEMDLKYVGLNECFIRSMDRRRYDEIPEAILRYFSYKNVLSDEELAYIYANVIMNKDRQMSVYRDFVPAIERFMERMIMQGTVSDDLTVIYDEFLDPETVKPEFAARLINIIFKRKFVCNNENITDIIVSHSELGGEVKIPVVNGEAYVEIISQSAIITMLDDHGGRYVSTVPYRLERIVDERSSLDICQEYCPKDYRYLLFLYNDIDIFTHRDAKEINLARDIVLCPEVSYKVRQEALTHMVEYYHENFDADILRKYLSRIDLDYVDPAYASRINTYYITLGMYEAAFEGMYRFGYVDVDIDELINIAEFGIDDKRYDESRLLISICVYIYRRGYAGQKILSYLINNYNGSLDEMANLFKSVNSNYRNIDMLSENILAQMMFADGYIESIYDIFEVYYRGRSRGMVVKAFLRYCAHQYLIKDHKIPSYIMEDLYKEIEKGNIKDEISRMSLLYYFSNRAGRYSEEQQEWIRTNVKQFIEYSKILPFFRQFESFVKLPGDMKFKTYVIFKGDSGRQVWVSYSFGQESSSMAQYKSERMNEIIPGIYVKEVVVFHGESLIYSIDGVTGTSVVVESDILKNATFHKGGNSSFELINSMLVSQETRNDHELIQAMDTYLYDSHFFDANLILL